LFDSDGCQIVSYARQQLKKVPITLLTTPKIVDALLTLISEWGSDSVAFLFAYEGCQYVGYVNQRPN